MSFTWHFCFILVSNTVAVASSEIWAKPTLFWTWICIASVQLLSHAVPSPSMYCVWQNVNHFVFFWNLIHPPYIIRKKNLYSPLLKLSSQLLFPSFFAFTFECCSLFKTILLFWLVYSCSQKCCLVIMWIFTAEYSLFHTLPCYFISNLHKIFATVLLFLEAYWFLEPLYDSSYCIYTAC